MRVKANKLIHKALPGRRTSGEERYTHTDTKGGGVKVRVSKRVRRKRNWGKQEEERKSERKKGERVRASRKERLKESKRERQGEWGDRERQ